MSFVDSNNGDSAGGSSRSGPHDPIARYESNHSPTLVRMLNMPTEENKNNNNSNTKNNMMTAAMTKDQFNEFMSYVRGVVHERKEDGGSSARSSNISNDRASSRSAPPSNDELVPLSSAMGMLMTSPRESGDEASGDRTSTGSGKNRRIPFLKRKEPSTGKQSRQIEPPERVETAPDPEELFKSNDYDDEAIPLSSVDEEEGDDDDDGLSKTYPHHDVESSLNEDTFSFVITAPVCSVPFWTGIGIFLLKTMFYCLTLADLMNITSSGSVWENIPVAVVPIVAYTQIMALCIAVLTQNDMVTSLKLVYEGFGSQDEDDGVRHAFVGAQFVKWLAAAFLLFSEGLLGLLATLFLTVTSTTILDVLLNFAAVEFISSLDESAFFLATIGYLGKANRRESRIIADTTYGVPHKTSPFYQVLLLILILFTTLFGYSYITNIQLRGHLAPSAFIVQFDDSINPLLATHSGTYLLQANAISVRDYFTDNGRFRYTEESATGGGQFDYCHRMQAWTFFLEGNDPCENIVAISPQLNTFDILETASLPWKGYMPKTNTYVPLSRFYMSPVCDNTDGCGENGTCNNQEVCECDEGFFGPRCEFDSGKICKKLAYNELFQRDYKARRELAQTYHLVYDPKTNSPIQIYQRPVYVNQRTQDFIFYAGLRWLIASPVHKGFKAENGTILTLQQTSSLLLSQEFHASKNLHVVDAASEPVFYHTSQDASTPSELQWNVVVNYDAFKTGVFAMQPVQTQLICSACDDTNNPCLNANKCMSNGQCQCAHGESGALCQVLPLQNGICDPFYNNPINDYDKGDCCAATCQDATFSCGTAKFDDSGAVVSIGFPYCRDESLISSCDGGERCYVRSSEEIQNFFPPPSVTAAAEVSENGQALVLGERGRISTIRITRIVDGKASPVGDAIEMGPAAFQVGIASSPANIERSNAGTVPRGFVVFTSGTGAINVAGVGAVAQQVILAPPIELPQFGLRNKLVCPSFQNVEGGFGFVSVQGQSLLTQSVLVHVNEDCYEDSRAVQKQFGSLPNSFLFLKLISSSQWTMVPLGLNNQTTLSGNGVYAATYLESSRNLTVFVGDVISANPTHRALEFSLPQLLQRYIPNDVTVITTVEALSLSHNGHELSVAANAWNASSQEVFGIVARFVIFEGPIFDPVPLQDITAISYLDTFHPFSNTASDDRIKGTLVFSQDGCSFAVLTGTTPNQRIDVYSGQKNNGLSFGRWEHLSTFIPKNYNIAEVSKFALSSDGSTLVVSSPESSSRYVLRESCATSDDYYKLSLSLDSQPDSVSWSLVSILALPNGNKFAKSVIRECRNCYGLESDYSESTVAEHICVPKALRPCIGLRFSVNASITRTSIYALRQGDLEIESLTSFAGDGVTVHNNGGGVSTFWDNSTCPQTPLPTCRSTESPLMLALTFNRLEGPMTWAIESERTGAELINRRVQRQDLDSFGSTIFEQLCVAGNVCWSLVFTGSFDVSHIMGVYGSQELPWSGSVVNPRTPKLQFGNCPDQQGTGNNLFVVDGGM